METLLARTEERTRMLLGNLALAGGSTIWATHFPLTERLLELWDPLVLLMARTSMAALVLFMVSSLIHRNDGGHGTAQWRPVVLLGAFGIAASTALLIAGVYHSGSVNAGLVAACGPLVGALFARFFLAEPLRRNVVAGVALAITGGSLAVFASGAGVGGVRGGELLVVAALCCWVWYSVTVQRWLPGVPLIRITALTVLAGAMTVGFAVAALVALGVADSRFSMDLESLATIAWLACGPSSLCIVLWHFGVSRVGVTVATMYTNMTPVVVVAAAYLMGRDPTPLHLAAGGLIICGVTIAQWHKLRAEAAE